MKKIVNSSKDTNLSRRDFIKVAGVFAGSAALAACAPQVTVTSEVTVTLTPTLTPIPTSSSALPPEIQEKFADSKVFRLEADGTVTVLPQEEGGEAKKVKGLLINQDGSATVSYQGENKEHQGEIYNITGDEFANSLKIDKTITFKDADGVLWTFDPTKSEVLFPEITQEMSLPNEFPQLDAEGLDYALTSPEFDQKIFELQEKGRFIEPTGQEIPIEPGDLDFHYYFKGGQLPAFSINNDKFDSKEQVPVQVVAIYNFDYDGFQGNLLIERWADKSGNPKFRKVIFPFTNKLDGVPKKLLAESINLGYNTPDRFPVGTIIQNNEGLENYVKNFDTQNPDAFKQFYNTYKDLFEKYHNLYENLNVTGIFDNDNGIPVIIASGLKTNTTGK